MTTMTDGSPPVDMSIPAYIEEQLAPTDPTPLDLANAAREEKGRRRLEEVYLAVNRSSEPITREEIHAVLTQKGVTDEIQLTSATSLKGPLTKLIASGRIHERRETSEERHARAGGTAMASPGLIYYTDMTPLKTRVTRELVPGVRLKSSEESRAHLTPTPARTPTPAPTGPIAFTPHTRRIGAAIEEWLVAQLAGGPLRAYTPTEVHAGAFHKDRVSRSAIQHALKYLAQEKRITKTGPGQYQLATASDQINAASSQPELPLPEKPDLKSVLVAIDAEIDRLTRARVLIAQAASLL